MRYGNWDVLLFPHGSKTPTQEFRTQCFVTRDNDVPFVHDPAFSGIRYISDGKPLTQLPVLTTFVGTLVHNAPFRVSIHSWEQPEPSRMLDSLARPGDSVTFEARVYIDGALMASSLFNQRTMWPHVIDLCSHTDKEGYQEPLLFPPFHQEILHASSWDAGQLLGRIRIVITEGFSRETNTSQNNLKHSFIRIRDVLAFSFQHAPMHILEFSGIAWPNPGMWAHAQSRSVQGAPSGNQRHIVPEVKEEEDAHAHSPRRPSHGTDCIAGGLATKRYPDFENQWSNLAMPPPQHRSDVTAWNQSQPGDSNLIRQNGPLADPFLEQRGPTTTGSRRGGKKSSEDTPMPDVPSYEPSKSILGLTGVSYGQKEVTLSGIATHEAIMNQLVEALSPLKSDDDDGPHNPTNTPSSGRMSGKSLVTVRAGPASRRVTGADAASPETDHKGRITGDTSRQVSAKIISSHPAGLVQSKKGSEDQKENTPDNRMPGSDFTGRAYLGVESVGIKSTEKLVGSSDSKRKRPLEEVPCSALHNCIHDSLSPSPSKKVSKVASEEVLFPNHLPRTPEDGREVSGCTGLKAIGGVERRMDTVGGK